MGWRQAESRWATGDKGVHPVTITPSSKHTTYVGFAHRWDTGPTNVSGHMRHAMGHIAESVKIIPMLTCRFVTFLGGKSENERQENTNVTAKSNFPTKTNTLKKGSVMATAGLLILTCTGAD